MRKEEIRKNNIIVEKAMEEFKKYFRDEVKYWNIFELIQFNYTDKEQLLHCSATVYEFKKYTILVSYKTIVAFINKDKSTLYDVLRRTYGYTVTSAQHISKFANMHKLNNGYRWYPL